MTDTLWLYVFCYFGDKLTDRYACVGNQIYQFDWYLVPIDMQKCLPVILTVAQKNVYLRGSFGAQCTRDTFKKVNNITRILNDSSLPILFLDHENNIIVFYGTTKI